MGWTVETNNLPLPNNVSNLNREKYSYYIIEAKYVLAQLSLNQKYDKHKKSINDTLINNKPMKDDDKQIIKSIISKKMSLDKVLKMIHEYNYRT